VAGGGADRLPLLTQGDEELRPPGQEGVVHRGPVEVIDERGRCDACAAWRGEAGEGTAFS